MKILLLLFLVSCSKPKFYYDETVIIIGGFFKGQTCVIKKYHGFGKYNCYGLYEPIEEDNLERLK